MTTTLLTRIEGSPSPPWARPVIARTPRPPDPADAVRRLLGAHGTDGNLSLPAIKLETMTPDRERPEPTRKMAQLGELAEMFFQGDAVAKKRSAWRYSTRSDFPV